MPHGIEKAMTGVVGSPAGHHMKQLPTVLFERILHALSPVGDFQIGMVISCSGSLDSDMLRKAIGLSVETIPHLGCRFVPGFKNALWEKLPDIDPADLLAEKKAQKQENDLISFFSDPIDHCTGPQVQALLRKGAQDTLCLKLSHQAADAGGVKEYAYYIAGVYRALQKDSSVLPDVTAFGPRGLKQILDVFPFRERLKIPARTLRDLSGNLVLSRPATIPGQKADMSGRTYRVHRIGKEYGQHLMKWGHHHGFTLNDMLMAAALRVFGAMQAYGRHSPRLIATADLRRYLPSTSDPVIANLSGWIFPRFDINPGNCFFDACRMVHIEMNRLKSGCMGLGLLPVLAAADSCLPLSWMKKGIAAGASVAGKRAMVAPSFTNMGNIDHHRLDFGDIKITDSWLLPPIVYPPVFGFGVSGYLNSITLSAGFCSPGFASDDVEDFFRKMEKELLSVV